MTSTSTVVFARPVDPIAAHVYVVPVVREIPLPQPSAGPSKGW